MSSGESIRRRRDERREQGGQVAKERCRSGAEGERKRRGAGRRGVTGQLGRHIRL